ncbi:MAG: universal stress protein [Clostridiaceae bacterium]
MAKYKILVPLDGSEKSMHSLDWLKKFFSWEDAEVTLLNVNQRIYSSEPLPESLFRDAENESRRIVEEAAKRMDGYNPNTLTLQGYAPDVILNEAVEGKYDLIIMTKSSVKGISRIIGSVTSKVVRDSEVAVVIIPE